MLRKSPAIIIILISIFIGSAHANQQDFNASAFFTSALSINNIVDMDFGVIEYSGSGNLRAYLSPIDGSLSCNNSNYQCPASGTPGSFQINGDSGAVVDISCERRAVLSDSTNTLNLVQTAIYNQKTGLFYMCRNLGRSTSFTLRGNPPDSDAPSNNASHTFLMGGMLRVQGGIQAAGVYSTANAGGDPISIRVVYQ
ncbi:MAG: hypothetical protein COV36_01530 [Alphaproteobacteria bacterium CG11_big_fil_rev_8_21_14_0_20_44_7]|nr:MAG: hypothetical protein COV36_01530 [Alphaproteobacteria bacterium CG11_big_fil_rev_8_21_14_0_20_44_7]